MNVTLEIATPLLKEAEALARSERTTLGALVERGLRHVLSEHRQRRPFKLRDLSFEGQGLQPDAARLSWKELRARAHVGRGG
jgi:hypothetical protein